MLPQVGIGGCAPKPRKLKPASSNIAEAKLDDARTNIGPNNIRQNMPANDACIVKTHRSRGFNKLHMF